MRPTLLVTNVKSEMISKAGNKERLKAFLNTVNAKMILKIQFGLEFIQMSI